MAVCSTRSSVEHSLFGNPSQLVHNMIPTCMDVFKAYCYNQTVNEISGSFHDRCKIIATAVKEIYCKGKYSDHRIEQHCSSCETTSV